MSEIIKYIIDNFTKLTSLDYSLIFVCTIVIAFCLFLFFKWLFGKVVKTQHDVITLKDNIISCKDANIEKLEKDRKELENLISQIQSQNKFSGNELKEAQNRYFCLTAVIKSSVYINTLYRICSNIKSELLIYTFLGTSSMADGLECQHRLYDSLTTIEDKIKKALDELSQISSQVLEKDSVVNISKSILDLYSDKEIIVQFNKIEASINNGVNLLNATLSKGTKKTN
jgi:hypothetical protein